MFEPIAPKMQQLMLLPLSKLRKPIQPAIERPEKWKSYGLIMQLFMRESLERMFSLLGQQRKFTRYFFLAFKNSKF